VKTRAADRDWRNRARGPFFKSGDEFSEGFRISLSPGKVVRADSRLFSSDVNILRGSPVRARTSAAPSSVGVCRSTTLRSRYHAPEN